MEFYENKLTCEAHTPAGGRSSVQLIAEKGKEDFYINKGFKQIPHEFRGNGMRKVIKNKGRMRKYREDAARFRRFARV